MFEGAGLSPRPSDVSAPSTQEPTNCGHGSWKTAYAAIREELRDLKAKKENLQTLPKKLNAG